MDASINQALTSLFPLLFVAGVFGWFFRVLGNRSSNDYKRTAEAQENLIDIENISLLELARLYRGELRGEDVAPLIVSWAGRGCVQLRFHGKGGGQTEISLKKLKDLPEHSSEAERAIFKSLFNKAEGKVLPQLKFDDPRIDPEKLARLQDNSAVTKLNAFAGELSTRFSLLLKEIGAIQNRETAGSRSAYQRFTFLELFICLASLFMLGSGFSFFIEGQIAGSGEFYAYAGLGLLLVGVYFGALYRLGRAFSFANILGYLGVGFLVYLAIVGIETGYKESGSFFFKNSFRYFGFVFGSLLSLLAPTAHAMTDYGRSLRDFFKTRRETICEEAREQTRFWQVLPELMLYGCVASPAKKLELKTPDWYDGPAGAQAGRLDPAQFSDNLERMSRELHMLAIVRR